MADTTTELEVLDEIVDVLGGQSGQHKTVVPVLEDIRDLLSGGGGGGGGYNPALSVGRADALTGADSTAQWATRESTGSGTATVRSVQGAAVAWNQMVQTTNGTSIASTGVTRVISDGIVTLNGTSPAGETSKYVNVAGSTFVFTNGHKYLINLHNERLTYYANVTGGYSGQTYPRIFTAGADQSTAQIILTIPAAETVFENEVYIPQCFDLTQMFGSGNEPTTVAEFESMYPEAYYPYSAPTLKPVRIAGIASTDANGDALDSVEWEAQTLRAAGSVADMLYSDHVDVKIGTVDLGALNWVYVADSDLMFAAGTASLNPKPVTKILAPITYTEGYFILTGDVLRLYGTGYADAAAFKSAMNGVIAYYVLNTPTTTPISPALPMTYKVQAGGSESIIVPAGEVSATPVLTIAEGESAADVVMDALACIATPDGPVATSNHAVNTYLTMQGKLYKVTSAIAVGETITPNTNVTETTVMAELSALAN